MKITAVKSYTVHPGGRKNLIFVKVAQGFDASTFCRSSNSATASRGTS